VLVIKYALAHCICGFLVYSDDFDILWLLVGIVNRDINYCFCKYPIHLFIRYFSFLCVAVAMSLMWHCASL
jgi:hypothetical protein